MPVAEATINIQPEIAQSLGRDLEAQTQLVVVKLANVKVATVADCQQAVLDRQDIGERIKTVETFFEPFKSLANKLHKSLCAREKEILAPLHALDSQLRLAIGGYKQDEDRRRRDEEQRQAQIQRQAEEARLTEEAAQLEASGETALAASVLEQAIATPAPVVVLPDATKAIEGLKFRRTWKWRYANNDKARAMALIPRDYLMVDESRLTKYATAMRETAKVPGVEFYSDDVPVR